MELIGGLLVEDAGFLECGEGIGVKQLSPFVTVITGGVASLEDVAERRRDETTFGGIEYLDGFECLGFEGIEVG